MREEISFEKFMSKASGHFLVNPLPEEFMEWDEEKVDNYIDEHKTCWFNNCEPHDLYEIIECLANEFQFLHEHGAFEFD